MGLVRLLIHLYIYLIIADAILSYLPQYRKNQWAQKLKEVADFSLNPIRKLLPMDLPVDLSPIVLIIVLNLLMALW